MRRSYLGFLIFFLICWNIFGQFNDAKLKKSILKSELNIQNITLDEALGVISRENNLSIISTDAIKDTPINLVFREGETIEDILNSLIKLYNLKVFKSGNIYILSERKEGTTYVFSGKILSKYGKGLEDVKITLVDTYYNPVYSSYGGNFVLTDVEPGVYLAKFEKAGYETKGEIVNLTKENMNLNISLSLMNKIDKTSKNLALEKKQLEKKRDDFSQRTNLLKRDIVDGIEVGTQSVYLYNLKNDEVKNLLKDSFGDKLKISSIDTNNMLVLSGEVGILKNAIKLIDEVDKDREQIRVDAQILDVSDNLFEALGFDWIYNNRGYVEKSKGWDVSLLGSSSLVGIGNAYSSSVNILRQFNGGNDILNLGINLLQATQDLVISSKPSILVMDRQEGSFKVTEEVIVGEEKEENDNNDRVISTPIFKEAGIILKVTPTIKKDGWIILKVVIEISNFKLKLDENSENNRGTFNSEGGSKLGRSIETTVKVRDGETIFIGGLKKATVHNLDSKIPFFGTLPMINIFFKNQNVSHEITDIYVKMKVSIVGEEKDSFEKEEIHQRVKDVMSKKIY